MVTAAPFAVTLLALTLVRAGPAPADEEALERPPTVQFGLPTGAGPLLWAHPGSQAPPDRSGVLFRLEAGASRMFGGRPVDVLHYVPRTPAGEPASGRTYGQADFVDPSTGEVVGGLDGWGGERYPDEGDAAPPCPGR